MTIDLDRIVLRLVEDIDLWQAGKSACAQIGQEGMLSHLVSLASEKLLCAHSRLADDDKLVGQAGRAVHAGSDAIADLRDRLCFRGAQAATSQYCCCCERCFEKLVAGAPARA